MEPLLARLIAEHLQDLWAGEEPGDGCFDRDAVSMDRLLGFIDGTAAAPDSRGVRDHLLRCPRCRYIFAAMRGAGPGPGPP